MEAPRPPFPFRSLCARCARNREIASSVRTERNDNFGRGLRIMMPILCPLGYYDRSLLHAILFVSQAIFFASFLACPLATPKSAGAMLANGHNNSCTSRRITVTAVSEELDLTSASRIPIGRYQGLCSVGITDLILQEMLLFIDDHRERAMASLLSVDRKGRSGSESSSFFSSPLKADN